MSENNGIKIIVVGGTAGGMSAALRARELDGEASITLIERGNYISYADSGTPSSLRGVVETDTFLIQQSPTGLKARFNLDVRARTELLILAEGPHPDLPCVQGIERANVFAFQNMTDLKQIQKYITENNCRSVAILGGGYLALKALECLYSFGLRISIIHAREHVFQDFDLDLAGLLQTELMQTGIELHMNTEVQRLALGTVDDGYIVTLANNCNVPADIIVVANTLVPETEAAKASGLRCKHRIMTNAFMQTSDPDIYAVDNLTQLESFGSPMPQSLPLSGPASQQGRLVADHIMRRAAPYNGPVGVYACKTPHLTAGIVGQSVERLRELGYYPQSVTVHVPHHAGYYPTSQQMTLRLAFQPSTGRLLSGQVIGRFGVERRIDVLSTALQARMSVFDLELLELSYEPQYGSAKDPVNVAGMVASNLLRGDLHIVSPSALEGHLQDWQIIDVRSSENFVKGHVTSARSVPIYSLHENLACMDIRRPVLVYSRIGYHGYLAYRTLVQLGYHVANLDGGFKSFVDGGFGQTLVSSE